MKPTPEDWLNIGGLMAHAPGYEAANLIVTAYCKDRGLDLAIVNAVMVKAADIADRIMEGSE